MKTNDPSSLTLIDPADTPFTVIGVSFTPRVMAFSVPSPLVSIKAEVIVPRNFNERELQVEKDGELKEASLPLASNRGHCGLAQGIGACQGHTCVFRDSAFNDATIK